MAEVETRVASRRGEEEKRSGVEKEQYFSTLRPQNEKIADAREFGSEDGEIFTISPTLKFVKAGYIGAAVAALLLVALTSALLSNYVSTWVAVLLGLLLFLVPAFYHIRQKFVRYTLTESKLEIDSGFISRTTRNVPIRRIQDVTVSATPWQRLLGIGDIVIDNASDEAGKTVLKNIDAPKRHADELLEQMRRLER
jgi:uncharacterized membrane protein YdbT with pleckstrin-like domain